MKKFIITVLFLFALPLSASAANGDAAGKIYSTDIRAYINGVEVPAYNIGGKTAIVVEDVLNETEYIYDNISRTLKLFSLHPDCIIEGRAQNAKEIGKVAGNIYETDIKTSVYGVILPSYNIGGKTAVAIEDLGYDNTFSPIGGKYIWNETDRTIRLEFLYDNAFETIPDDKVTRLAINEDATEFNAEFEGFFHCGGGQLIISFGNIPVEDAEKTTGVIPVKADGEIIGYYCRHPEDGGFYAFNYFIPDKITEAAKTYTPVEVKTREGVIQHFMERHSVGEPVKRFDTDEYSFVCISVTFTSGCSYHLLQAFDDGTYVDYLDGIHNTKRYIQDFKIDEENEKITFSYVDRYTSEWYTNYEIDLKNRTIKEI